MDKCEACETRGVGLAFVADVASSGPQEPQPCAFPNRVAGLGQCANAPRCDPTPTAPGRSCLAYSCCVRTLLWYLKSHAPEVPISCKLRAYSNIHTLYAQATCPQASWSEAQLGSPDRPVACAGGRTAGTCCLCAHCALRLGIHLLPPSTLAHSVARYAAYNSNSSSKL